MPPKIDPEKCNGCGRCEMICPGDILFMDKVKKIPIVKYPDECFHCGNCRLDCPTGAIEIVFPLSMLV